MESLFTPFRIGIMIGLMTFTSGFLQVFALPMTFSYEGTINQILGNAKIRPTFNVLQGERLRFTYTFDASATDILPTSPTVGLYANAITKYSVDLGPLTYTGTTGAIVVDNQGFAFGTYTVFDLLSMTGPLLHGFQASSVLSVLDNFSGTAFPDDRLPLIQPNPERFDRSLLSIEFQDPSTLDTIEIIARNTILLSEDGNGNNAVPEPSTILLFSSGLVGLIMWRYRQRLAS